MAERTQGRAVKRCRAGGGFPGSSRVVGKAGGRRVDGTARAVTERHGQLEELAATGAEDAAAAPVAQGATTAPVAVGRLHQ